VEIIPGRVKNGFNVIIKGTDPNGIILVEHTGHVQKSLLRGFIIYFDQLHGIGMLGGKGKVYWLKRSG
jgi:hypothetical protein